MKKKNLLHENETIDIVSIMKLMLDSLCSILLFILEYQHVITVLLRL